LSDVNQPTTKKSNWRGFTLQLFLITILPLTALLLTVAFGSQMLHHDAMRSLVGDRDLRTVRATSSSLEREISHLSSTIRIVARSLGDQSDLSNLILSPLEISAVFDGGIALYAANGALIRSSTSLLDWQALPSQIPEVFKAAADVKASETYSTLVLPVGSSQPYIFVGIQTGEQKVLIGAFSPARLIQHAIGDLASSGQTTVLVIGPGKTNGAYEVLYRAGPFKMDQSSASHPGIQEALKGESGINYFESSEGEHVVAFNSIPSVGWGLVIEEAWEDIASPYLMTTQSAPLVIVPVFLLALIAIWFGARRIVTPLQRLEKQAAGLALGDFAAIHQPVGGIEEIRNLQSELIDMADKLEAAQQSLRSYIGSITASVETERRSLARELHDDTIQALIALNQRIQLISMNVPGAQKVSFTEIQDLVQQSMSNLRRMIRGLRPIYLEDLGLVAALEMLVREIEQTSALPIAFSAKGAERRMDNQSEMSLYRMVQESLNNVVHHAYADQAWVELKFTQTDCSIQIRDDGKGFVVPNNPGEFPKRGHFGLLGLHERAELIGAELEIESKPGVGTIIKIGLSMPKSENN
jgi:signal transduction histidine kinase